MARPRWAAATSLTRLPPTGAPPTFGIPPFPAPRPSMPSVTDLLRQFAIFKDLDNNGFPVRSKAWRITNVKYPAQKVMFTCYRMGIAGGAHKKDGLTWCFADGHAALIYTSDVTPRL